MATSKGLIYYNPKFRDDEWYINLLPEEKLIILELIYLCQTQIGVIRPNPSMIGFRTGVKDRSVKEFISRLGTDDRQDYIRYDPDTNELALLFYSVLQIRDDNGNIKSKILNEIKDIESKFILDCYASKPIPRVFKQAIYNAKRSISQRVKLPVKDDWKNDQKSVRSTSEDSQSSGDVDNEAVTTYLLYNDIDSDIDSDIDKEKSKRKKINGKPESMEECKTYFLKKESSSREAEKFWNFYESKGWKVGKSPMAKWRAAASNWIIRAKSENKNANNSLVGMRRTRR